MNSLNIVSRLTASPSDAPPRSRKSSVADIQLDESERKEGTDDESGTSVSTFAEKLGLAHRHTGPEDEINEKTPLLQDESVGATQEAHVRKGWQLPRRVAEAVLYGVKVVFTTITAPGRYVIACFYDENGHFSAIMPLKNLRNLMSRRKRKAGAQAMVSSSQQERLDEKAKPQKRLSTNSHRRSPSMESTTSTASSTLR